jgi:hypothetical protein
VRLDRFGITFDSLGHFACAYKLGCCTVLV